MGRDGRFRIDDVAPGEYSLSVRFEFVRDAAAGGLRNHRFRVPPAEGALGVLPVDLGILWLEKR